METLLSRLDKAVFAGYTADYRIRGPHLLALNSDVHYLANQVRVVDFFRYEGMSDPEDNSILYMMETDDGGKGTLIDGYGMYSDDAVGTFMHGVYHLNRKY
jgi:hypothetical protein